MGLHQDMPDNLLPDRAAREHRARIWWTSYVLDRLWASKMGHPVSIQDDDIAIELPSNIGLGDAEAGDFADAEYLNASIRLASISRDITTSIYNRKIKNIAFSQRVQKALSDLRGWVSALPKHLQIEPGESARPLLRHVKWLHLSFNQVSSTLRQPRCDLNLMNYSTLSKPRGQSFYTSFEYTRISGWRNPKRKS